MLRVHQGTRLLLGHTCRRNRVIPSNPQLIHRLIVSAGEMVPRMMRVSATACVMWVRRPFFAR
jgi:hypothetical protein